MKNRSLYIAIICWFSLSSHINANEENGLLWKISVNGLEKSSYLFGTIHYPTNTSFFDGITGFEESFNASEYVIMEVDTIDMAKMKEMAEKTKRLLPDTVSYADLLNDTDLHFLDSLLQKDFGFSVYNTRLRPQFLEQKIQQGILDKNPGMENDSSQLFLCKDCIVMDFYIRKTAKEKQKKTCGLDDIEREHSEKFEGSSLSKSAQRMVNTLKYLHEILQMVDTAAYAYSTQDMISCVKYLRKADYYISGDPENTDILNDNNRRNLAWMEKILPGINNYACFIAVGAAHLPGEYGLINLLRKEGYSVEAVR